jgi:hypothetical protein
MLTGTGKSSFSMHLSADLALVDRPLGYHFIHEHVMIQHGHFQDNLALESQPYNSGVRESLSEQLIVIPFAVAYPPTSAVKNNARHNEEVERRNIRYALAALANCPFRLQDPERSRSQFVDVFKPKQLQVVTHATGNRNAFARRPRRLQERQRLHF